MSEATPTVSLVLVNFHSGGPLRRFFASRQEHPPSVAHEVIVVDNSPRDGVGEWLAAEHPDAQWLAMPTNVGYARAVNAGLERARGAWLAVVNPDVELSAGGLENALDYLRANPEVGMVGAQLLNRDGTIQRNARRFYSLTTILLRRTPLGKALPEHPELRRHLMLDDDLTVPGPVDWITGAFMLVRREALREVGPMDERFFLYFEDVDWCYRMWEGGWEVHLVPSARLVHGYQRTSTRMGRSLVHHLRSFLTFFQKWGALVYVARQLRGRWRTVAAVLGDVVALNLAFLSAFFVRRLLDPLFPEELFDLVDYLPLIAFINLVSLVTLPLMGRYRRDGLERGESKRVEALRAAFFVTLVVMAVTYLSYTRTFSRAVLLLFVPFYLGALALTRALRDRLLGGRGESSSGIRRALLVGEPEFVAALWPDLRSRQSDREGRLAGAITLDGGAAGDARVLGSLADLGAVVDRYRVSEILLDGRRSPSARLVAEARTLAGRGIDVSVDQPWAQSLGSGHARHRLGRSWWPVPPLAAGGETVATKEWIDRPVALLLCLLSLPGFVLCSLLGRPTGLVAMRRVRRQGLRGREIAWSEFVGPGDGRAWPGIVQLPRFWQVVAGRLALVGPRPLDVDAHQDHREELGPVQLLRTTVRPGLTGPWAHIPRSAPAAELAEVELEYLENWTLALDLDLFLSALPRLLFSRGRDSGDGGAPT